MTTRGQARTRRGLGGRAARAHVVLSAWTVARRRDSAEVIGSALLEIARGLGHRRIAARLQRLPGTVAAHVRQTRRAGHSLRQPLTQAPDTLALDQTRPASSPVLDAVDALGGMAHACRLRFVMSASPLGLAVTLTGLLYGSPRGSPGFE